MYTVDSNNPWAEEIAIRGDRIVAAGKAETVEKLRGPRTRLIDAGGRLVLPRMEDSHFFGIRNVRAQMLMTAAIASQIA